VFASQPLLTHCSEFNEVQTDKRNAYRNKVAESKAAAQSGHGDDGDAELDRDGQPATKKARLEPGDSSEMDASEMPEGYNETSRADDDGEDDEGHGDEEEDDDEEQEEPDSERLEVDEPLEEADHGEAEDEALDNGDDSD
jgi:DNA polymerase epsilon subunit 3